MSLKDAKEVSTESDFDDETTHVPSLMVKSSKKKELKKFDFVTKSGEHVHLTEEHIKVVNKYYNDKLQYDRYCDKMLNRRAKLRITNYDILTINGPITLKLYREDDTSEIILEFKASDLHLGKWREVVKACPNKKGSLVSALQVLKRLRSIFTSVHAANVYKARKGIATESDEDPIKKMVPASTIVRLDPDEEVRVPYMINAKMCNLTNTKMQAYLDKEEKLRKATEKARLLAISKPEVIKVVNNNKRNFNFHQPFKFINFGITELDQLGPIIQKKKNFIVKDLMTSLSKRYERLKKIPEELGIQYALSAPVPEQASS
ncbi:hypothetical protein Tco_0218442 [Tanacetum coccineum]